MNAEFIFVIASLIVLAIKGLITLVLVFKEATFARKHIRRIYSLQSTSNSNISTVLKRNYSL
jgi:hypothetical protein